MRRVARTLGIYIKAFIHSCEKSRVFRHVFKMRLLFFSGMLFLLVLFEDNLSLCAATYKTPNFIVNANTIDLARRVGEAAEQARVELALLWLGETLPRWSKACDIVVETGVDLVAAGETVFTFSNGEVYGWKMTVQGSEERLFNSVLPHEITHTLLASYLHGPAPRWLDEGIATTVESNEERRRYRTMLVDFLHTQRGIAFNDMVSMKEYPKDLTPFYSQAFSICEFLILVGGHRRLFEFARIGQESGEWESALLNFYNCNSFGALQVEWLDWIRQWDIANQPTILPKTRTVPDFSTLEKKEIAFAHSCRLSKPNVRGFGVKNVASNISGGKKNVVKPWNSIRCSNGENELKQSERLARAQSQSRESIDVPNAPFGGILTHGRVDISGQIRRNDEIKVNETRNETREMSSIQGNRYAIPKNLGVFPIEKLEIRRSDSNHLFNGAGSATREQYERVSYEFSPSQLF